MSRPSEQVREFKREVRQNAKLSLKEILSAPGEPIVEDAFDYTEVPFRLSQEPGVLEYDAHERCSAFQSRRWPYGLSREFDLHETEEESNDNLNDVEDYWSFFLYNELITACHAEPVSARDAPEFTIRQLKSLLRDFPDRSGENCYQLCCIPVSGMALKYDIVNEAGVSESDLCAAIRSIGWKTYSESLEAVETCRAKHEGLIFEEGGLPKPDFLLAYSRSIAYLTIGNAWVIYDKVFIPHVSDLKWLFDMDDITLFIRPEEGYPLLNILIGSISSQISKILLGRAITDSKSSATFYVKEQIVEEYLWAKVVHLPTPCAREHFRYNFLHPDDEILEWTSGEKIDEWEQADVRIRLGSKLVPPKRAIVDRIRRNLQKLSMENPEKKKLRAVTQSMRRAKPHRVVYDKYKMSCCIRFCWEYCSYCHEIGHTFSKCERVSEERIDQHINRMNLNKH